MAWLYFVPLFFVKFANWLDVKWSEGCAQIRVCLPYLDGLLNCCTWANSNESRKCSSHVFFSSPSQMVVWMARAVIPPNRSTLTMKLSIPRNTSCMRMWGMTLAPPGKWQPDLRFPPIKVCALLWSRVDNLLPLWCGCVLGGRGLKFWFVPLQDSVWQRPGIELQMGELWRCHQTWGGRSKGTRRWRSLN